MTDEKDYARELLDGLAALGRARFGDAVKDYWFHRADLCPACMKRSSGAMKHKGQNAVSLNGFMYRERGVLIGYMLCGPCARRVLRRSSEGEIHKRIERNLIAAYLFEQEDSPGESGQPS